MKRGLNITEVKTVKSLMGQHLKEYFDDLNLAFDFGFQDPKYVKRNVKCFT